MSLGLLVRAAGLKMALVDDPDASDNVSELALDHLLKAAKLKLVLMEDQEALARAQPMYEPRAVSQVRLGHDGRDRARGRRKPKVPAPSQQQPASPPLLTIVGDRQKRGSKYG